MADTPSSVASLQTLLADNVTGAISPQDLRNFLVSALGIYGSIYVFEGATEQSNVGTTGTLLTCFDTDGPSNGTTPANASDQITCTVAGTYEFHFYVCFSGTNGGVFQFRLRKNGTEQSYGTTRVGGGASFGSASFGGQITLAANDILTIYVNSDTSTDDLTVSEAQFTVRMIG